MSFVIDKTVTDKAPKKTVVSQFTGNNSTIKIDSKIFDVGFLPYHIIINFKAYSVNTNHSLSKGRWL
jgi:hypothetical protein